MEELDLIGCRDLKHDQCLKKSLNKSIIGFFIYFINFSLIWSYVSNLGVALFNLESFVFLVKVGVSLFDLESMGHINIP